MEKEEVLREIGFSGNEARIYLALLRRGPSLVSIIVEETKVNRTHIYDRLKKLLEKGIVSYTIRSGKKYFQAISPDKLLEKLEEREEKFRDILPELLAATRKKEEIDTEVYTGKEGLKTLLQDIIKEKKELLVLGFTGAVARNVQYYYPHYLRKMVKLGIRRRVIADYKMGNSRLLKRPLTECKFIPKEYHNPSGMWVYGEKTVIFLPGDELYMILIRSRKVARLYKNYFDILWKMLRMTY